MSSTCQVMGSASANKLLKSYAQLALFVDTHCRDFDRRSPCHRTQIGQQLDLVTTMGISGVRE